MALGCCFVKLGINTSSEEAKPKKNLNARPGWSAPRDGTGKPSHSTASRPHPHHCTPAHWAGLPQASVGGRRSGQLEGEESTCHPANASHHPHLCPSPASETPAALKPPGARLGWSGRWSQAQAGPQGASSESHISRNSRFHKDVTQHTASPGLHEADTRTRILAALLRHPKTQPALGRPGDQPLLCPQGEATREPTRLPARFPSFFFPLVFYKNSYASH